MPPRNLVWKRRNEARDTTMLAMMIAVPIGRIAACATIVVIGVIIYFAITRNDGDQ